MYLGVIIKVYFGPDKKPTTKAEPRVIYTSFQGIALERTILMMGFLLSSDFIFGTCLFV
jgi:hypothetical protein